MVIFSEARGIGKRLARCTEAWRLGAASVLNVDLIDVGDASQLTASDFPGWAHSSVLHCSSVLIQNKSTFSLTALSNCCILWGFLFCKILPALSTSWWMGGHWLLIRIYGNHQLFIFRDIQLLFGRTPPVKLRKAFAPACWFIHCQMQVFVVPERRTGDKIQHHSLGPGLLRTYICL